MRSSFDRTQSWPSGDESTKSVWTVSFSRSLVTLVWRRLLENLEFSEFFCIKSIKVSECYFHVKVQAVYGVTEDCFEIELTKVSFFASYDL